MPSIRLVHMLHLLSGQKQQGSLKHLHVVSLHTVSPCSLFIPDTLVLSVLDPFVSVGVKGVSEHYIARRYSTGTLSTTKPPSNASVKSNGLSKTGNIFFCFVECP